MKKKHKVFKAKKLHARKTIKGHASPPLTSRKTKSQQTLAKRNKDAKIQALPNRKKPKSRIKVTLAKAERDKLTRGKKTHVRNPLKKPLRLKAK